MTQPTKPLSVDEILVSFYNEVESDVLDSRNSGGNGRVITEGHTKAKAQLIELVESLPELQPAPYRQMQWPGEPALSSCETCGMGEQYCCCCSENRLKEYIKQALIKAIEGGK